VFDGRIVTCDFFTPDGWKTARKVATIIEKNKGRILFSIGTIEIPVD
jgi:hypothetical protein